MRMSLDNIAGPASRSHSFMTPFSSTGSLFLFHTVTHSPFRIPRSIAIRTSAACLSLSAVKRLRERKKASQGATPQNPGNFLGGYLRSFHFLLHIIFALIVSQRLLYVPAASVPLCFREEAHRRFDHLALHVRRGHGLRPLSRRATVPIGSGPAKQFGAATNARSSH